MPRPRDLDTASFRQAVLWAEVGRRLRSRIRDL